MRLHELTSLDKRYKDTKVGHGKTGYTGRTQNRIGSSTNRLDLTLPSDINSEPSNMTSDWTKKDALNILKAKSNSDRIKDKLDPKHYIRKAIGNEPIDMGKFGSVTIDPIGKNKSLNYNKKNVLGGDFNIDLDNKGNSKAELKWKY